MSAVFILRYGNDTSEYFFLQEYDPETGICPQLADYGDLRDMLEYVKLSDYTITNEGALTAAEKASLQTEAELQQAIEDYRYWVDRKW